MKKRIWFFEGFFAICIFMFVGCESTGPYRYYNEYKGESEQLLSGTKWQMLNKMPSGSDIYNVDFMQGGNVVYYDSNGQFLRTMSNHTTWQRVGNTVIFIGNYGYVEFEFTLNSTETKNINGIARNINGAKWDFTMSRSE